MKSRRLAAVAALALAVAGLALAIIIVIDALPGGLAVIAMLGVAGASAWYGATRRGAPRALALGAAAAALVGALLLVGHLGVLDEGVAFIVVAGLCIAAARTAFAIRTPLDPVPKPRRPVLFYNPKSGGGKAERFHLAEEARQRGIEPIELRRGDDLEVLVRDAVARGADGLAMAGGDGSQAIVAGVASEVGLPFACVPAGTRNHLALDLGVDRDDVVGALDAFVDGGERVVDLAEVNGRVFVNNVSLGLYAQAVQRAEYRDAKLRTILDTVPDVLGPDVAEGGLRWRDGAVEQRSGAAILVSNNRYRLGRLIGSGTRPRLDEGVLGITVLEGFGARVQRRAAGWRELAADEFEVGADGPVAAGIDGEAAMLEPPLRFRIRPAALRVRIARQHPGASPSVGAPNGAADAIRSLASIALRGERS